APRKEPPKREAATGPEKRRERAAADVKTKDRTLPSSKKERDTVTPAAPGTADGAQPPERREQWKAEGEKADEIQFDKERFIWPVKGKVISRFGIQPNKMNFNGVRIAAAEEAAVQAAAAGIVIFSAPLKDYGETIIIRHEDNYATVYTHLGTRTVRGDTRVNRGDRIAFLGKAGANDEPYLYFEIRHKNKARNPLFFLP
ncbi:MAG: M23 family metallopeptidase, partial [Thermodesulfobacteriota bacterium]